MCSKMRSIFLKSIVDLNQTLAWYDDHLIKTAGFEIITWETFHQVLFCKLCLQRKWCLLHICYQIGKLVKPSSSGHKRNLKNEMNCNVKNCDNKLSFCIKLETLPRVSFEIYNFVRQTTHNNRSPEQLRWPKKEWIVYTVKVIWMANIS